jgi:hypothetical protein
MIRPMMLMNLEAFKTSSWRGLGNTIKYIQFNRSALKKYRKNETRNNFFLIRQIGGFFINVNVSAVQCSAVMKNGTFFYHKKVVQIWFQELPGCQIFGKTSARPYPECIKTVSRPCIGKYCILYLRTFICEIG